MDLWAYNERRERVIGQVQKPIEETLGILETMIYYVPPKDYTKMARSHKIEFAPLVL